MTLKVLRSLVCEGQTAGRREKEGPPHTAKSRPSPLEGTQGAQSSGSSLHAWLQPRYCPQSFVPECK